MKFLIIIMICAHHLYADDFTKFLELTQLTQFSDNLLKSEQHNIEQFIHEVQNFTCLSDSGKQAAIKQLQALQHQTILNESSINKSLQDYMEQYLRSLLTDIEVQDIIRILQDSHYGRRIYNAMVEQNTDILNMPFSALMLPSESEETEIRKNNYNIESLRRIISLDTKRQILMGNKAYRKDLQAGIKNLQQIFMQEGCAIE